MSSSDCTKGRQQQQWQQQQQQQHQEMEAEEAWQSKFFKYRARAVEERSR